MSDDYLPYFCFHCASELDDNRTYCSQECHDADEQAAEQAVLQAEMEAFNHFGNPENWY